MFALEAPEEDAALLSSIVGRANPSVCEQSTLSSAKAQSFHRVRLSAPGRKMDEGSADYRATAAVRLHNPDVTPDARSRLLIFRSRPLRSSTSWKMRKQQHMGRMANALAHPWTWIALVASLCVVLAPVAWAEEGTPLKISAYLPEYRLAGVDWDRLLDLLRDGLGEVILFSIESTEDGALKDLDRMPSGAEWERIRALSADKGVGLFVCLGGAGRSHGISRAIMKSDSTRAALSRNVRDYVVRTGFDGIDVDWEAPTSEEEWRALADFVRLLRADFADSAKVISLAIHPGQEYAVKVFGILEAVDHVHQMAYDNFCQVPKSSPPCEHSTLGYANIVINHATEGEGLDAGKLMLGVPFYGRDVYTGEAKTVDEIFGGGSPDDWSGDRKQAYSFNSADTLRKKADLAKSKDLRGIMIWGGCARCAILNASSRFDHLLMSSLTDLRAEFRDRTGRAWYGVALVARRAHPMAHKFRPCAEQGQAENGGDAKATKEARALIGGNCTGCYSQFLTTNPTGAQPEGRAANRIDLGAPRRHRRHRVLYAPPNPSSFPFSPSPSSESSSSAMSSRDLRRASRML